MQISESDSLRIDSLVTLSRQLSDSANYEEAIRVRTEALNLQESFYGKENGEYAYSLNDLAIYNYSLCNYSEAISLGTDAMEIYKKVFGPEHPDYLTSLSNLAEYNSLLGNYSEAIRLGTKAMETRKIVLGAEHPDYAMSINNLARYYSRFDNYSEALRFGTEAMEICKKVFGTEHEGYATTLSNLASYNYSLGNYSEAIRLGTEAMKIFKKVLGSENLVYATSLNNLANYNLSLGNYSEALRLGTEAMEIRKEFLGTEHPDYAMSLNNLSFYNSLLGNYSEAIRLCSEAMEIRKMLYGTEHPDYATSIGNLAKYNHSLGNYSEAIRLGAEAMEIRKKLLGLEHSDYAESLDDLAVYNSKLGNYSDAIRLGTEAMKIFKKVFGSEHPDYATSLNNLAGYNSHLGNYSEALRLGMEAMEIYKKVLGVEHPDYATSLSDLAWYNSALGNYLEAVRLCAEAMEIRKKVLGVEHPDYATSLSDLAWYNSALGNYLEAVRLCAEAMKIRKKVLGVEHPDYATSLNDLAVYNSDLGNYLEAIRLCTEAKETFKKVFGSEHPDYATSLSNLALYNSFYNNYSEAIYLGTNAMGIRKRVFGIDHPDYALSLNYLASYYSSIGNDSMAADLMNQSTDIMENHVLKMFSDVSSYMRNQYWDKNKDEIIKTFSEYVYRSKTHIGDLYDKSALFAKGLLLNADTELGKLVGESGDTLALKALEELRTTRSILNKLYEKPIAERFLDTDSLEQLERRQEADLMRMSKVYGDFTRNLRMTWRDVQKSMKAGEVAIEFLSFPLNEDSTMYIALTLKPGYDCPKMTTLCEEKQLTSVPRDDIYTTPSMYKALWQPLEEELKDVKTVYFSPSGALYNIGIEYLPTEDGTGIYEHYDLYRLSSTRQIALKHDKKKDGTAVLYGGIKYDADTESLESENSQYTIERGNNWNSTFVGSTRALDDSSLRGGCGYLPGTKIEVDNISSTLTDNGIANKSYSDIQGTEESFKALGGTRPNILHIATHGFYWTESDAEKVARLHDAMRFLQTDNDNRATVEDKALTRSGLMMAGSNRTINGERLPDGVDDGILTAKEISQVDLRGCDLVVLSACQTALGDVSGSEGVFGLQRAFKKSGVQTLLMSMWKVDDTATQIMMTEFYQNLASGMSKRRAFLEAQQSLHDVDDDPSHWAAFVMLDAIE